MTETAALRQYATDPICSIQPANSPAFVTRTGTWRFSDLAPANSPATAALGLAERDEGPVGALILSSCTFAGFGS